ncbi:MAG TPA: hypothetical protein VMQ81_11200 [Acidimicrobiia bacterium]|nr:hypothetical protein [Acidimicrobiia bacterium]
MSTSDQLVALLGDLDASIARLRDDPYLSDALDRAGATPEQSIDEAIDLVEGFSEEELEAADGAFEASPAIARIPGAIDDAVAAAAEFTPDAPVDRSRGFRATTALLAPAAVDSATYTDNCPAAGDPAALIIAVLVLNQLQSAAYAAVIAMPSVIGLFPGLTFPNPGKVILGIVYGVALAVYLALAQTLAVASDCAAAAGSADLKQAWPVAPDDSTTPPAGSPVNGSSQISVDAALESVGDVAAILNSVTTNLTLVEGQVTTLGERATALNTTLSCTSGIPAGAPTPTCGDDAGQPPPGSDAVSRTADVQNDLQTAQGDVDILRNTQETALAKSNDEIVAIAALRDLEIRMAITANLSDPGFEAIALFQLPEPWGYLDVAAAIVTQTVADFGGGEADLQEANAAKADGRYKDAYKSYHKAYQGAMK